MKKFFAFSFVVALALFYLASGSTAQTVQGVITGTVTDPSGASVPGATVTITNAGTDAKQTTTTESDGSYRFPLVPPGQYILDVKAASFAEFRASGIVVQASQVVPFPVKLELAKGMEVIEVREQVPLVQTATSDLATQVDRTIIENAALPDRDVLETLPFLAPGATRGLNGAPTVGGARESGTAYLLNGADNNDNFSEGAINIHPPLESVQDFSILTNDMGAQYGRAIGAVVSVNQKSGTNSFHGAAYEFNRNDLLNANDFFSNKNGLAKRKYVRNQFGGELDGPIKKDKTFFSGAYDEIRAVVGTNPAQTVVPTSAAIAYLKANGGPIANAILAARPPVTSDLPCPSLDTGTAQNPITTGTGTDPVTHLPGYWNTKDANGVPLPNPQGCLSFSDPISDTERTYYGRVDHNFSDNDRLSFTANVFREALIDKFGGAPLTTNGPVNGTTNNHWHQLVLTETHVFGPRLFNEFSLTHVRHFNVFVEGKGAAVDTLPQMIVDNQLNGGCYSLGGDFEGGVVQGFVQDRSGATDSLTFTRGKHTLRVGGGFQYGILYRNWDLGLPGQYEFGELSEVNSSGHIITPVNDGTLQSDGTIAGIGCSEGTDFAGDYPYFQETATSPTKGGQADAYRHYTYHDYNWFAQDDWKVTARLTLNLGVRWERYGAPSEVHGVMAQFTNLGCNLLNAACINSLRVGPAPRMWPTRNNDYAPRIGFAWDPTGKGKMAVRGGFGISFDRIFDNIWSNGAWNPPFYALLDFDASGSDSIFYSNPASIGLAYNPNGPNGPIPYPGKRVSIRTMDQNMKDSSSQNYFFSLERQFFGGLLVRSSYRGSLGRHLPMLENYNRVDGQAYYRNMVQLASNPSAVPIPNTTLTSIRPNPLYTGFNYRSNSVSSNYNSLVVEAEKHMGHGLQFQTGYTYSKLLDVNSELFAGCSTIGGTIAPYYYITNHNQKLSYGRASFDARHAYKFNVIYELPFWKAEKGFAGHAFGGWTLASFFQLYTGHPFDMTVGRGRIRARSFTPLGGTEPNGAICTSPNFTLNKVDGCRLTIKDQNGVPYNVGGDYNLDGVANDHPDFIGSSLGSVYSGASPADGVFADNNKVGCGEAGVPNYVNLAASSPACAGFTPSTLFGNPAYPTGATPYERFGSLGRNVFHGPKFVQMDLNLSKNFKLTERWNLKFSLQGQNILNHPSFDCINGNLASDLFGKAQCLAQSAGGQNISGLGLPVSRIMSVGATLKF